MNDSNYKDKNVLLKWNMKFIEYDYIIITIIG